MLSIYPSPYYGFLNTNGSQFNCWWTVNNSLFIFFSFFWQYYHSFTFVVTFLLQPLLLLYSFYLKAGFHVILTVLVFTEHCLLCKWFVEDWSSVFTVCHFRAAASAFSTNISCVPIWASISDTNSSCVNGVEKTSTWSNTLMSIWRRTLVSQLCHVKVFMICVEEILYNLGHIPFSIVVNNCLFSPDFSPILCVNWQLQAVHSFFYFALLNLKFVITLKLNVLSRLYCCISKWWLQHIIIKIQLATFWYLMQTIWKFLQFV